MVIILSRKCVVVTPLGFSQSNAEVDSSPLFWLLMKNQNSTADAAAIGHAFEEAFCAALLLLEQLWVMKGDESVRIERTSFFKGYDSPGGGYMDFPDVFRAVCHCICAHCCFFSVESADFDRNTQVEYQVKSCLAGPIDKVTDLSVVR